MTYEVVTFRILRVRDNQIYKLQYMCPKQVTHEFEILSMHTHIHTHSHKAWISWQKIFVQVRDLQIIQSFWNWDDSVFLMMRHTYYNTCVPTQVCLGTHLTHEYGKKSAWFRDIEIQNVFVTPVAGSIFWPLSQTHFSRSEFKNEISSSDLLDIQMTLLCVCGVGSFIPELEHWIEKVYHGLFSKKKPLKSDPWIRIHKMKLRSISSAENNFPTRLLGLLEKQGKIWRDGRSWNHF